LTITLFVVNSSTINQSKRAGALSEMIAIHNLISLILVLAGVIIIDGEHKG